MLAPSCRTRRAMRPAEIIGFGCVLKAPAGRVITSAKVFSLVGQRRDGRARWGEASEQSVMTAEAAVEVERLAAGVHLGARAAVGAVAEDHAAAAGQLEPPLQTVGLGGED